MLASSRFKMKICASSIASATVLLAGGAQAQFDGAAPGAEPIEEIAITGSRISRSGFETPTPVSVLSDTDINAEAPGSVAEFVMTMPSVQGSTTATTNSGSLSNGAAGIAALNLRSLGTGRTLVLFDGQRSVVSSTGGQVDTNTFPQPLVKSVEVVTGGASSAYGSDAISGVVNFILDKDYTGFKSAVEYGQNWEGDGDNRRLTMTAGAPLANGDGHVLFSAELYDKDGIHYTTRDWGERGFFAMPNPDESPGAPDYIISEGIGISNYAPGGLINSGPLQGTYFGEGGSVNQLNYGAVGGQWMLGGDWEYTNSGMLGTNSLAADDKRESIFGRVSYSLSPTMEVFAQGSWAGYEGHSYYINPTSTSNTIYADNAFLPGEVRQDMLDLGLETFNLSTSNGDMPASGSNNTRESSRFVVGANGEFALLGKSWGWDTYYQRGVTQTDEHMTPTFNFERLAMATDAVFHPDTGEIVCRSSITEPANGCVPMNRFGTGVTSQESLEYVMGRPRREQEFQQDVAAINFTTNDFEGWAGPISLAFGAEWREEQVEGNVAPEFESGWKYGNYKVTEGTYDVREAYVETLVPLLDRLDFNGAARYTDYSTSGGVTTWKAGLTWVPIDDLTFRLTQSRDIRAPNLGELYAAGTARTNAVAIGGESVPFIQNLQGNPSVSPEEADTLGIGVVVQPRFLPGLAASVDYYEIEIDGVIDFVAAQGVANYCFEDGVQLYCDRMNYDSDGNLETIDLLYENLNVMEARGVDYELSYSFGMYELFDRASGDVTLRAMATNYLDDITDDGTRINDSAGENTGNTPDWVYRLTGRYTLDDWMFNLTARGVSDGVIDNDFIECVANCPETSAPNYTVNENDIDGEIYFDAYLSRTLYWGNTNTELFVSVKNLFDTDPVLIDSPNNQGSENNVGYPQVNRGLYDVLGRNFRLGFRTEF